MDSNCIATVLGQMMYALSIMSMMIGFRRIVSNFFRMAPDGTVRGFSSPAVHERSVTATVCIHIDGMLMMVVACDCGCNTFCNCDYIVEIRTRQLLRRTWI